MHIVRIIRGSVLALALLSGVAGCRHSRIKGPPPEPVRLRVLNRGFFDVVIYAISSSGSSQMRLGTATGLGEQVITVPANAVRADRSLTLQLHAIGTRRSFITPAIYLSEGEEARLEIFSRPDGNLDQSTLYVVPRGGDHALSPMRAPPATRSATAPIGRG